MSVVLYPSNTQTDVPRTTKRIRRKNPRQRSANKVLPLLGIRWRPSNGNLGEDLLNPHVATILGYTIVAAQVKRNVNQPTRWVYAFCSPEDRKKFSYDHAATTLRSRTGVVATSLTAGLLTLALSPKNPVPHTVRHRILEVLSKTSL